MDGAFRDPSESVLFVLGLAAPWRPRLLAGQ
jgi:hypothetical protein